MSSEDFLDDGTPIRLKITIDGRQVLLPPCVARFDFAPGKLCCGLECFAELKHNS